MCDLRPTTTCLDSIDRQNTACTPSRGPVRASTAALQAQVPHRQSAEWNLLHEEQSTHEQPAVWERMAHDKQVQPAFTALDARCTTGAIAPADRTAMAGEEPTADITSAFVHRR